MSAEFTKFYLSSFQTKVFQYPVDTVQPTWEILSYYMEMKAWFNLW